MTLYYFHLRNGGHEGVPEGVHLPDLQAARRHAETCVGALIDQGGRRLGPDDDWCMQVTDETGRVCFSFDFAAAGAAAGRIRAYRERAEQAFPIGPPSRPR